MAFGTSPNWKSIRDLPEPFNDALNYQTRTQKELFNKLFLRTEELRKCLAPTIYYLMGEKGAGKTAYAVYLQNNNIDNYRCQVTTMTETQYARFIQLKRRGKLDYSDYANIWRSILLFVIARMLITKSKSPLHNITGKFRKLETQIAKWPKVALNPEVEAAFEAVSSETFGATLGADNVGEASGEARKSRKEATIKITHHLPETEGALRDAIASLSLAHGHVLFFDGIDYRPEAVPYPEYIECIKGLGEAIWQLNTEFFGSIRDSKGRIKIILLVRPDVFHALNLYNSNSRLQDNTVFLNWSTTETEYRYSRLYEVSGKYFSAHQDFEVQPQTAWDHYYEKDTQNGTEFKRLLKHTFQKPRDILTFIRTTREHAISSNKGSLTAFPDDVSHSPKFTREFADYMLGEVRNYAAFYMTQEDFSNYLKFFQYLNGQSRFPIKVFREAHEKFSEWASGETFHAKEYLRDADALLQFFYDVNVLGYSEETADGGPTFIHWSYRERSLNNIAPKVKAAGQIMLNPGIAKALDIGKGMKSESVKIAPDGPRKSKRKQRRGR